MKHRPARLIAGVLLFATASTALAGCTAVDDLMNRQSTSTFDDRAAFVEADLTDADWVPGDATEIVLRTPADTSTGTAALLLVSETALPETCAEGQRNSGPTIGIEEAPDVYTRTTVLVCGEWSVISTDDGWYGWTPNTGDVAD